jgi:hypothetical protein
MNNITKLAAALVLAFTIPAGASLAADKPKAGAAKAADAKPSPAAGEAAKAAGPKLQMARATRNPGKDVDLRHCLDLGSNAEVIKCAEQGERKE